MTIKKACRNCGREKNIVCDGLCGGCYGSVRGMEKDTPEYFKALADAKKRFNDPDYKPRRGCKKSKFNNSLAHEKQNSTKTESNIIVVLETRRHELMQEIDEINKTIEVIKRYKAA